VAGRGRIWLSVIAIVVIGAMGASLWLLSSRPGGDADRGRVAVEHPGSTRPIPAAPLSPRIRPHAAWTGRELLIWSGAAPSEVDPADPRANAHFQVLDDGAAYDPAADSWRPMPAAPISGRVGAAAVWADDRLVIWGGFPAPGAALADGAAYLPDQDTWVPLPPAPITGRGDATAVWTGREVLIVGGAEQPGLPGQASGVRRDGAAYDPATGSWRKVPPIPDGVWPLRDRGILPIRQRYAGTWTGEALFVWGRDIAHYRPETDDWTRTSAPPADIRIGGGVTAVPVGDRVVVVGLARRDDPDTFGITHEAGSGRFGSVPAPDTAAMNRPRQVATTGRHVVMLSADPSVASMWELCAASWRELEPAVARGTEAAVVWTGQELLVWGGSDHRGPRSDGVAWRP
jgi:hypothetical protein